MLRGSDGQETAVRHRFRPTCELRKSSAISWHLPRASRLGFACRKGWPLKTKSEVRYATKTRTSIESSLSAKYVRRSPLEASAQWRSSMKITMGSNRETCRRNAHISRLRRSCEGTAWLAGSEIAGATKADQVGANSFSAVFQQPLAYLRSSREARSGALRFRQTVCFTFAGDNPR